jgi:enoyl-CoA hydratase/carnithine racemase
MRPNCCQLGLIHHLVPREQVLQKALEIADELSRKAPLAMRLNKAWLREMTEAGFRASIDAAIRAPPPIVRLGRTGAENR